jgi:hypothetical protein
MLLAEGGITYWLYLQKVPKPCVSPAGMVKASSALPAILMIETMATVKDFIIPAKVKHYPRQFCRKRMAGLP